MIETNFFSKYSTDAALKRERSIIESPQGAEIQIAGKNLLSFSSNDYLGLANHPEIKAAAIEAIQRYGVGSGASHLITGHHREHHLLEEVLAEFLDVEAVLVFSTGYMANIAVITTFFDRRSAIFADRLNHASLIDGGLFSGAKFQRYRHGRIDDLERRFTSTTATQRLVMTDGVFSMDGDIAPLPELTELCKKSHAILMVDDAHGLGVLGKQGKGSVEHCGLIPSQIPILVGTLGKAFGTNGAFVAGSRALIEALIQKARMYIYTTAMPPAIAAATRKSLEIIQQESWRREHLCALVNKFRAGAAALKLPVTASVTPIQPIIVGGSDHALKASALLLEKHIQINAIRPPTVPKGQDRLRITFSAAHTHDHVDRLLDALAYVFKRLAIDHE